MAKTVRSVLNMKGKNLLEIFQSNTKFLLNDVLNFYRADENRYNGTSLVDDSAHVQEDILNHRYIIEQPDSIFPLIYDVKDQIRKRKKRFLDALNLQDRWALEGKKFITERGIIVDDKTYISKHNVSNRYDLDFKNTEGYGGQAPTEDEKKQSAKKGFILGQLLGKVENQKPATPDQFQSFLNFIAKGIRVGRLDFRDFVKAIHNPMGYAPNALNNRTFDSSFNRPQEPKPMGYSLEQILTQNKLRPRNNPSAQDVFRALYIDNEGQSKKFPQGIIGGVGVHELEEPDQNGRKVFKFANDQERYNLRTQQNGFNANINVANDNNDTAVYQYDQNTNGVQNADVTQEAVSNVLADRQFFPFLLETINKSPTQYCFLQATLNQLQESYNPNWSSKLYFGRTEQVYTYTNTDRVLDFSFAIFATSMRELQNVYERVNWLGQQVYPDYEFDNTTNNQNRLKSGPLVRLTIGDMFKRIGGFIRSLSINWDHLGAGGKWELTKGIRMPVSCQVNISFQVIHEKQPTRDHNFYKGLTSGGGGKDGVRVQDLIPLARASENSNVNEHYIQRVVNFNQVT